MSPVELGAREYLEGVIGLFVVLVGVGAAAVWTRERLVPDWDGAPARLAEAVLGIFLLISLCLILGTLGLLTPVALVAGVLALAVAAELWSRRALVSSPDVAVESTMASAASDRFPSRSTKAPPGAALAALAVITLSFALWGMALSWSIDEGITNFDSVWYHLPFATEITQSGSTLGLHRVETVFLNWFYPQGSELLHAVGMVMTGRDAVSLAINMGWLGLAYLAAWCIGRPYGRGHLTVAAVAILLTSHNLVAREPGTAKNDIAVIALLLTAVALLVNGAWGSRHSGAGAAPARGGVVAHASGLRPPLILAAIAAGLAVGVKVTALAPVVALVAASVALSPSGRRLSTATTWLIGLLAGGGYWYARNLVIAGNPLPQIREIGPLTLPGPESLQSGRPDFTVAHYLFDRDVWVDYFLPGLERGFGVLWPAMVGLAILGAVWATMRLWAVAAGAENRPGPVSDVDPPAGDAVGEGRTLAAVGIAALVGMAAYLVTPLGAAGAEGEPTAFAINLRFAIPALVLGLALAPILTRSWRAHSSWAAFAVFVALIFVTNGVDRVVVEPGGRLFGWSLVLGCVVVPAITLFAWRRLHAFSAVGVQGSSLNRRRILASALVFSVAGMGVLAVAAGYSLQRTYLDSRYTEFEPDLGLVASYRWANGISGESVALAGTTAGFHGYGFYGPRLDNSVTYLGREAASGGFHPIETCQDLREQINSVSPDYVVTSPFLNFLDPDRPIESPEQRWIENDPAVTEIVAGDGPGQPVTAWYLDAELDPEGCGDRELPHREVPDTPGS